MKGVPTLVEANGESIIVKLGNMRMPLGETQCKELFGRKPKDATEARMWAFRLRKSRKEVEFPNMRTNDDKKRKTKVDGVNTDYKNIQPAEGKGLPTYDELLKAANDNDVAVKSYKWDDKHAKLDIQLHVPRHKVDPKGQAEAQKKLAKVLEAAGIAEYDEVSNSD